MFEIEELIIRDSVYKHENFEKVFESIDNNTLFFSLIEKEEFLERILISSRVLYLAIIRAKEKEEYSDDIINSVMKYYLRMSTRSIPFGLNSSIGYINDNNGVGKDVRPSNIWLNELRKIIEISIEYDSEIKIQVNNMIRVKSLYIEIDSVKDSKKITMKIKRNKLLDYILLELDESLYLEEAIIKLKKQFGSLSKSSLLGFIKKLITNDIIITDIKPHTFNFGKSCLDYMITVIDKEKELKNRLKGILTLLDKYAKSKVGEGIAIYNQLITAMRSICPSSEYLVVDLIGNKSSDLDINEDEINELIKSTQFFNKFRLFDHRKIQFENYKMRFLEKYGQFNEVSLLEVINEDWGLGLPDENLDTSYYVLRDSIEKKILEKDTYIFNKWLEIGDSECGILELTDNDISILNQIINYEAEDQIKMGYDIKFNISNKSGQTKFILTNNSYSSSPYAFLGRFNLKGESTLNNENYLLAGVSILPSNYSDLGVSYNNLRANIAIGCITDSIESIDIRDIVVGFSNEILYLKSKKTQKIIMPVRTNLLYYNNFNELKIIHFLNFYTEVKNEYPRELNFPYLDKLVFLPRIEYKNVVLHTRKWKIMKKNILEKNTELTINDLEDYLTKLQVDSIVNLILGDMNITLVWRFNFSLNMILDEINKQEIVTLSEVIEEGVEIGRDYLITVKEQKSKWNNEITPRTNSNINRVEWNYYYYKIYYEKSNREKITKVIVYLLNKLGFSDYFIVYYKDPDEHMRIRFKCNKADEKLYDFEKELNQLLKLEDIIRYSKNLFLPEVNRYGGDKVYIEIYNYFCLDSVYFSNLLEDAGYNEFSQEERGIFLVINVLLDFFPSYNKAFDFITTYNFDQEKKSLNKFKKNRNKYKNNVITLLNNYRKKYGYSEKRKQGNKIKNLIQSNDIDNEWENYIFKSIIHMVINRHLYVERYIENEIISLSRYCFYNYKYLLEIGGQYEELQ